MDHAKENINRKLITSKMLTQIMNGHKPRLWMNRWEDSVNMHDFAGMPENLQMCFK